MASGANARHRDEVAAGPTAEPRRVLVVATGALRGAGLVDELCGGRPPEQVEAVVVVPVVEQSAARRTAGELEPARERAGRRLEEGVSELRRRGVAASGRIGDTDPVLAVEDALREFPADQVLMLGEEGADLRPFEQRAKPERPPPGEGEVGLAPYLPSFERGDLAAIAVGIGGTILAIVFFAAGPGPASGAGVAQGLFALAAGLINLAHVMGILLFESVRYRGGLQRFARDVTLLFTPVAALVNLVILLVA